jgi:protein phosphatase slingshot
MNCSTCSNSCGKVTVARPLKNEMNELVVTTTCKECFLLFEEETRTLAYGELTTQFQCIDCKKTPARYNRNLMMSLCDFCREEKGKMSSPPTDYLEYPDEILENKLYLGSQLSACRKDVLQALQISVIVCCGFGLRLFFANDSDSDLQYYYLPIADSLDQEIIPFLPQVVSFIDSCVTEGKRVLIHCNVGRSRSASITIAYVMKEKKMSYFGALQYVKNRRDCVAPNRRFANDLEKYWEPVVVSRSNPV